MSQPYLSLEAEFHDAFWAADDDASEVALMLGFLGNHPGRVLEIGSGSGRLLFPLLENDIGAEGLELSSDMLALCRREASTRNLSPRLHQGDMSSWTPAETYDALLAPAFTFQLAADPLATLRHWRTWLRDGGGLYLTLFIPYAELEGDLAENVWYPDHETTLPDGRIAKLDTRHRLDPENQILERRHRYYFADRPGKSHESRQVLRWFHDQQMAGLLHDSGFRVADAFFDFDPRKKTTLTDSSLTDGILTFFATAAEAS